MKAFIEPSELIINSDGSAFHLHLRPEQLADRILLVGDLNRVHLIKKMLSKITSETQCREFVSATGLYNDKRVTLLSTGIGTDNIDIVMNELDALANIDFATRTIKEEHRSLRILRLGTTGAIQDDIAPGTLVYSSYSAGLDGLLNWYANRDQVCDVAMEQAFMSHMQWPEKLGHPYFVRNSQSLESLFPDMEKGISLSAPGFYGPQGRVLRLPLVDANYMDKLVSFQYQGWRITNFEMEGSAIAGLCRMLGHHGGTICMVIAQRSRKAMNVDYVKLMEERAQLVLDRLTL